MRVNHTTFSPAIQYQRLSREALTLGESVRIYFSILSGVALLVLTYYLAVLPHP